MKLKDKWFVGYMLKIENFRIRFNVVLCFIKGVYLLIGCVFLFFRDGCCFFCFVFVNVSLLVGN